MGTVGFGRTDAVEASACTGGSTIGSGSVGGERAGSLLASRAGGVDDVGSLAAKSGVAAVPNRRVGYGPGGELPP